MSREIKFRAWDKEHEEFTEFTEYKDGWGSGRACLGLDGFLYCESAGGLEETDEERYEVVFSTGLKDKNGTEIYEGDILKRGDFPEEQPQYVVRFGKFMDSHDMYYRQKYIGWYVDEIGKQDEYRNPLTYIVDMLDGVACGNIYEHPHLLSGDSH